MQEQLDAVEYRSPLHRRITQVGARVGLLAIGLTFAGGTLTFDTQPERPLPECWDAISQEVDAAAPQLPDGVPETLVQAASSLPALPVIDPGINSAALQVDLRRIRRNAEEHAHLGEFSPIQQFEMHGGINVTVLRDQYLPIDADMFNLTLRKLVAAEYSDKRIQAHMWCFKRDLESGRFEGRNLNLRIPAYANVCYGGLRLVVKESLGECNANGVTFPNPGLFGFGLRNTDYITATAGTLPEQSELIATSRINKSLYHEVLWHYYYSLLQDTWAFTPEGIDYDEQYADDNLDTELAELLEGDNPLEQPRIVPFANYSN